MIFLDETTDETAAVALPVMYFRGKVFSSELDEDNRLGRCAGEEFGLDEDAAAPSVQSVRTFSCISHQSYNAERTSQVRAESLDRPTE